MKSLLFASVSALVMSVAIAPHGFAQTPVSPLPASDAAMTPNRLVNQAYQGTLITEGIPSAETLVNEYEAGILTAADLVRAGVQSNQLPTKRLHDPSYLQAVTAALSDLLIDR